MFFWQKQKRKNLDLDLEDKLAQVLSGILYKLPFRKITMKRKIIIHIILFSKRWKTVQRVDITKYKTILHFEKNQISNVFCRWNLPKMFFFDLCTVLSSSFLLAGGLMTTSPARRMRHLVFSWFYDQNQKFEINLFVFVFLVIYLFVTVLSSNKYSLN